MSQHGELVFFTAHAPDRPTSVIRELLTLTGASRVLCASRSSQEGHEWEIFRGNPEWQDKEPFEEFINDPAIGDVPHLYVEGGLLHVIVGVCPLGDRIESAVQSGVPADLRGQFCPAEVDLMIGYHDLFECAETFEGQYFGRPFLAISFFSYGTPEDWETTREAILTLNEVQRVRAELAAVCGPLEQAIYWDV
jgi:hypothetical protein